MTPEEYEEIMRNNKACPACDTGGKYNPQYECYEKNPELSEQPPMSVEEYDKIRLDLFKERRHLMSAKDFVASQISSKPNKHYECPECHTPYSDHKPKFCPNCGKEL